MAHKKANALEISDIRVKYDKNDGSLRITSKDSDLKGKPFSLTVTNNSPTAETLLELMRERGLIIDNAIPTRLNVETKSELESFYDPDSPLKFKIGQTYNSKDVDIDLRRLHNVLIGGKTGSGRSVLTRNLFKQIMLRDNFQLTVFDPTRVEITKKSLRAKDNVVNTYEELEKEILDLEADFQSRWRLMEEAGVNYFGDLDTDVSYRFLILDSASALLTEGDFSQDKLDLARNEFVKQLLFKMIRYGWSVGIHFVISTSDFNINMIPSDALYNIGARILMGSMPHVETSAILGSKPVYGPGVTRGLGRAVINMYDIQIPVQTYFMPDDI